MGVWGAKPPNGRRSSYISFIYAHLNRYSQTLNNHSPGYGSITPRGYGRIGAMIIQRLRVSRTKVWGNNTNYPSCYSRSLSKISRVIPGHVGAKCEICHLNYLGQGACEVRNLPDQGKKKAPAGMYKGESGLFEEKKGPCGHVQGKSRLFEETTAHVDMYKGNPDFLTKNTAPAGMYNEKSRLFDEL